MLNFTMLLRTINKKMHDFFYYSRTKQELENAEKAVRDAQVVIKMMTMMRTMMMSLWF